jgi:hypothetical protein
MIPVLGGFLLQINLKYATQKKKKKTTTTTNTRMILHEHGAKSKRSAGLKMT